MTPTPQPLWICTNCGFKNNTNPLRCPACGWDEFTILMTPAPSPSPCEENGCTDTDNCDEICDHSRVYSPIQIEDAKKQAAAQAREKVLDELDKKIKHMQKESSELYNKATTDVGALAMNCRRNDCIDFRKFIQSLRSTPMTPKEQP